MAMVVIRGWVAEVVAGVMFVGLGATVLAEQREFLTLGEEESAAAARLVPGREALAVAGGLDGHRYGESVNSGIRNVSLAGGPGVWREDEPPTLNSLWGRRLVLEVGHGRTWRGSDWRWQREDWFPGLHVHSSQEDFNTARMVNRWLLPYLRQAGAEVYPDRCPDEQTNEVIVDPAALGAPHSSTGPWTFWALASGRGGHVFYAPTTHESSTPHTVQICADIPEDGYYGVTIWYPGVGNGSIDARFTVVDAAGFRHSFRVDQTRNYSQWVMLDKFYFEAGTNVPVMEVSSQSSIPGRAIILDAIRLGGGMGTEDFGGGVSGLPRWQENAICWVKYNGAPAWVWESDVTAAHDTLTRFNYAALKGADLFMRFHTNGSVYHTGFGTETFNYGKDAASNVRLTFILNRIIYNIRTYYRSSWTNRGVKANEISPWAFPHVLVELGFHDWLTDAQALMDADFRRVALRGMYEGTVEFFTNQAGTMLPEPPEHLKLENVDGGMVRASWELSAIGSAPEKVRVYHSHHPHCYKDYVEVDAEAGFVEVGPLTAGEVRYFQFRGWNEGGLSLPSETLAAMSSADPLARRVMVVNGYDRFDWDIDESDNHRNYVKEHVRAVADAATSLSVAVSIDSAANEVIGADVSSLEGYALVDWILGQESMGDNTLDEDERAAVVQLRATGGALLITGSDISLDLGVNGSPEAQAFLRDVLGAEIPVGRVGGSGLGTATPEGIFDGMAWLEAGEGAYVPLEMDMMVPGSTGADVALGSPLGVLGLQAMAGVSPVVYFSVPLEAVDSAATRRAVVERILPLTLENSGVADWGLY